MTDRRTIRQKITDKARRLLRRRKARTVRMYDDNIALGRHIARLEFGPWYWRWWQVLRHDGKPHRTVFGEPCVLFREYLPAKPPVKDTVLPTPRVIEASFTIIRRSDP